MRSIKRMMLLIMIVTMVVTQMPFGVFAEEEGSTNKTEAEGVTVEENYIEPDEADDESSEEIKSKDENNGDRSEISEEANPEGIKEDPKEESGEPTGNEQVFNENKADLLAYDPLYIAKYADPRYIDVSAVDMERYINVVTAAKGIATYNVKKQSDFEVTEENYIAGMSYEMPVYNVDDNSKYYVSIPSVNKFNENFREYDLIVAYNNDYAEKITGYKYNKGILYIPKTAIDRPKNKMAVPSNAIIAVQLNYAIGGDMDFSKKIPVQILDDVEPVNKTVSASNIFDADTLVVKTGIKNRKEKDVTVYLNGQMMPMNEDAWEYDPSTGEISIKGLPGVVSNVNIAFKKRTTLEKAKDATVVKVKKATNDAISSLLTPAYAGSVSMDEMTVFRTESGKEVFLDIPSSKLFVGWRGHYSGTIKHARFSSGGGLSDADFGNLKGLKNSVNYLYGGYTTMGGAGHSESDKDLDVKLLPLWAITSYALGADTGADSSSNNGTITKNEMIRHLVSNDPKVYEEHTIYEWLLLNRNKLEKSADVYGNGDGSYPSSKKNGIGGYNNFALQFPKTVIGSDTPLVSEGEDAGRENLNFTINSDEIDESYYLAASCNSLGDVVETDDEDDIYMSCLGIGPNYAVFSFVKARSGQNCAAIYKFRTSSSYVKLQKKAANTNTNFLADVSNNYSLEGAEYQLYTDSACTQKASAANGKNALLVTRADGSTETMEMSAGTYYAKEVNAPKGFETDKSVNGGKAVILTNDHSESSPYVISSIEKPAYTHLNLKFRKVDISGKHGYRRLLGTEYTIKYYDVDMGYGTAAPKAADIAGKAPNRTWKWATTAKSDGAGLYAGFDTATDEPISGSDGFYIEEGTRSVPRGVFTIEETKAAQGMAADNAVYYGRIYQAQNGAASGVYFDLGNDSSIVMQLSDDEQHPILEINKKDAETGKSSAQGTDREYAKGSLAGAEYAVYFDDPDSPGLVKVGTITTDENGRGRLEKRMEDPNEYLKGSWLDFGTYAIEEIKPSPGYTLDKHYHKEERGVFENGKHIIRVRASEGNTATFTYTVESGELPHRTVIHKTDITTGEELPGAKLQVLDSKGNVVEEWVSADKPHDIVCLHDETQGLKDGKYTLREITAPYGYDIAEDIEFSVVKDVVVNTVEMKNKPLEIGTTALDEQSSSHHGSFDEEEIIKDVVEINGLYKGRTYKVSGRVIDKASGQAITDSEGNEITAESEAFVADRNTTTVEMFFKIDSSGFSQNSSVVVFEKLYRLSSVRGETVPVEIAKHEDINDESQTIHYGGIAKTIATDRKGSEHDLSAKKKTIVIDTVEYKNLSPKETYFVQGTLYDKTTGELTEVSGNTKFVPEETNGTVQVEFEFDSRKMEGHSLVAFEYLFKGDRMISKHDEPDNKDQTVYIKTARKSPETGDDNFLALFVIINALAMTSLGIAIRSRRKER